MEDLDLFIIEKKKNENIYIYIRNMNQINRKPMKNIFLLIYQNNNYYFTNYYNYLFLFLFLYIFI